MMKRLQLSTFHTSSIIVVSLGEEERAATKLLLLLQLAGCLLFQTRSSPKDLLVLILTPHKFKTQQLFLHTSINQRCLLIAFSVTVIKKRVFFF